MQLPVNFKNESGVALILVAVLSVAIGVFLTLGLGAFDLGDRADAERETVMRMERVISQLSSFAQTYGRLPCPADPGVARNTSAFGREDRNGPGDACDGGRFEGLLPFRALGLQERDAIDAWGNFFTYAVSPVFTNLDGIADENSTQVYEGCLMEGLWVNDKRLMLPDGGTPDNMPVPDTVMKNLNPRKAKFCCPGTGGGFAAPGTDLSVIIPGGALADPLVPPGGRGTSVGDYNGLNTPNAVGAGPSDPDDATTIAIVLISHGANEGGVFDLTGSLARAPVAGLSANEQENADADRVYIVAPQVLANTANYYDDIVMFRNQYALYAETNAATCNSPYR